MSEAKKKSHDRKYYKRYSKGQVVFVDFDPQVGHEIKGGHYAVVISNHDTKYSPIVTVVPLTSKKHNWNVDLGSFLFDEAIDRTAEKLVPLLQMQYDLEGEIASLHEKAQSYLDFQETSNEKELSEIMDQINENICELKEQVEKISRKNEEYSKYVDSLGYLNSNSYADINQLTTIDKSRIKKNFILNSILRSFVIPPELLQKIAKELQKAFGTPIDKNE